MTRDIMKTVPGKPVRKKADQNPGIILSGIFGMNKK
jgi:hypothetical protein